MTVRQLAARGAVVAMAAFVLGGPRLEAQQPLASMPVRVDVTLSRFQGEKKTSSLPFGLIANAAPGNAGRSVSLRMGVDVPIGSQTSTENRTTPIAGDTSRGSTSTGATTTKIEYRSVGTNLDCRVSRVDDTRYSVYLNINDSSIYTPDGDGKIPKVVDPAAFRTFSTSNELTMLAGQTMLFGTGTDKISGETLKVEVTLTIIK